MLADARKGRFDTIVCWKSDRLSRGMYPAAALMEVVEAHQIRLEAVMDAIDMKTFGLMAAIGKIELDNFRERSTMGKRGTAKQGRAPTGGLPYGYRIGDDGRPEVIEEQAEVVRRIFHMYVHEGMRAYSIAVRLTEEGIPTQTGKLLWLQSRVHHILGNATYTGTWVYGKSRHISTEDGTRVYDQPKETRMEVPIPQLIDDETWERAQKLKKQRSRRAGRKTKVIYLLQHLLRCGECGHNFHARSSWTTPSVRNGKSSKKDLVHSPPILHVQWDAESPAALPEASLHPGGAVGGADMARGEGGNQEPRPDRCRYRHPRFSGGAVGWRRGSPRLSETRGSIQTREDRAITLFVSGKITEAQLAYQRKFITERLERVRARPDEYRARAASGAENLRLMEVVLAWAREVGQGLDELTYEQRKEFLQMVVEEVIVHRNDKVVIALAIPIESEPTTEDFCTNSRERTNFRIFILWTQ